MARRTLDTLAAHLSAEELSTETAFLRESPTWERERPYGWAWIVELVRALHASPEPRLRDLAPGTEAIPETAFDLTVAWLPTMPEPVRHGLQSNTVFGLRRSLPGARDLGRHDGVDAITTSARRYFADDHPWHFHQERSGKDFLSPRLCVANLMAEVLTEEKLSVWLLDFLSELTPESSALKPVDHLMAPGLEATVSDEYMASH